MSSPYDCSQRDKRDPDTRFKRLEERVRKLEARIRALEVDYHWTRP